MATTHVDYTVRPIDSDWPDPQPPTEWTTRYSPFKANWTSTMHDFQRELRMLDARNVVLQLALKESQIRVDGQPYANAKVAHAGVILSFESRVGPLRYVCGEFKTWEANLRAIALGLEALRKVDRYGITRRNEQYTGWKALPEKTGPSDEEVGRGDLLIASHGSVRAALIATHPDHGGDPDDFKAVVAARDAKEGR